MLKQLWRSDKLRFLVTGAFNTGFGYSVFVSLYFLFGDQAHYLIIATIAHALSVTVAFIGHRRIVFRSTAPWLEEFIRYNLSLATVFLLGLLGLYMLVDGAGLHPSLAQAIILMLSVGISYIAHRHFSFRTPRTP